MRLPLLIKTIIVIFLLTGLVTITYADITSSDAGTIDRLQLVNEQINLLQARLRRSENEFTDLQQAHDKELSQFSIEKVNKSLLDKANLEISVSKSDLDTINIELADGKQTKNWLEKSVQEIQTQLNVLSIFGLKVAKNEVANITQLHADLNYQQKLLGLEKNRVEILGNLQTIASNILDLRRDEYNRLTTALKSRKMLLVKQQQIKDELAYQEQQNYWLQELNILYAKLAKMNPAESQANYSALEREIFYTNENANYAYVQSLLARYKDQLQQMKLAVLRNNSISLLNEIENQVQILSKQMIRLDAVLKSRISVLETHITYLSNKKDKQEILKSYITRLINLDKQYKSSNAVLINVSKNLIAFRVTLERALQTELSARQGLPMFGFKTLLDLGKEMLLIPTLTFQVVKSLSTNLLRAFQSTTLLMWAFFAIIQLLWISSAFLLYKLLLKLIAHPSPWRDGLNSKWLSLQWLCRNFVDLFIIGNMFGIFYFFNVPFQNYIFIVYLSFVWIIFKSILILARLCLVESTHNTMGQDVKLYHRLKWIIIMGGVITAFTVFVHLLPLIYELKALCDRLFLLLLMIVSLLLLRSWYVVPNLILLQMEKRHPYVQKCISLIGILVPSLMFANSVIGLFGYLNLIMTVSWYEGVFLIVLIGYLLVRGLLSDVMEQISRLLIQHTNNGWLWTEAFLKPFDKVLRITLFLIAGTVLFLLYGWDKQSPIVERLTRLLHYQLAYVLNTSITPVSIIELVVLISIFYWTAKWIREFVYRILMSRTRDMGIRNSIAILSQYTVIVLGVFICLRVLGINLQALVAVAGLFAFGIGWGLRDLINNFASGFLILLERPLRVGDIVNINGIEGEVTHIGSRAVTVCTWDHMELVVPNTEIFNKSFTNWTARDNIVRTVTHVKISRHDNPHEVRRIIQNLLAEHKDVLKDPAAEVYLKEMNDTLLDFEIRYYVNIRQVSSRTSVMSSVLMNIWDAFALHGIKPPHPQREIVLKSESNLALIGPVENKN